MEVTYSAAVFQLKSMQYSYSQLSDTHTLTSLVFSSGTVHLEILLVVEKWQHTH